MTDSKLDGRSKEDREHVQALKRSDIYLLNTHESAFEAMDATQLRAVAKKVDALRVQYRITCDPKSYLTRVQTVRG